MLRKTIALFVLLLAMLPARAIGPRVEWGLLGGVHVPDYSTSDELASIKNKLGWQFGITTALGFNSWSIDPQILYVRQGIKLDTADGSPLSVYSNSIDVPVLLDKRLLQVFHLYAGPVFTVLNNCKTKGGGDSSLDIGRIRPTLSYTVGANIRIVKHLMIDLRYNGQFKSKHEVVLGGAELDRLRTYNVALSVGYIF